LMLAGYMLTALPENILAVVLFRRYGLLAPITLCLGEYLIFHILYGNFFYSAVFPSRRAQGGMSGTSVTPPDAMRAWTVHLSRSWPTGASFYAPLAGMAPGEVGLVTLSPLPGPVKLSSGVLIIFADDKSFTFMTREGHVLAAWITFSAHSDADDGRA